MPPLPAVLVQRLESMEALDKPAEFLAGQVSKAVPTGPLKDLLSGTWLGHPVHPLLITVPIGCWTSATLLDLLAGKGAAPYAKRLVGAGILSAFPTAMTGASDWSDTLGGERRVGLVHALGNYAAIGVYALSWNARRKGRNATGASLALLGASMLGVTGYLGGHLTYAYGVGVDTTAFQSLDPEWTDVAAEAEVPADRALRVEVQGIGVALARANGAGGAVHALAERCTHRGGPLSGSAVEDGCLTCPWHGSRFRVTDGSVERGPATMSAPTFEVKVQAGRVMIRRDEQRALRSNPV